MDDEEDAVSEDINSDREIKQAARDAERIAGKVANGVANRASNALRNGVNKITGTVKKALKMTPLSVKIGILAAIGVIIIVLLALSFFQKLFGDNSTAGMAMETFMSQSIHIAKSQGQGYYYKIDKDVIDKFVKAMNEAYEDGGYDVGIELTFDSEDYDNIYIKTSSGKKKSIDDASDKEIEDAIESASEGETQDEENIEEGVFSSSFFEDYFKTDNLEEAKAYLVKMIRTEIAGSYPRIGTYQGEDETEDSQGNLRDTNGDYVAQGMIKIERSSTSTEVAYDGKTNIKSGERGLKYYVITPEKTKKNLPMIVYLHGAGCVTAARRRRKSSRRRFPKLCKGWKWIWSRRFYLLSATYCQWMEC